MTRKISLSVNDTTIDLDYFVQGFVDHTVTAMVSALEGTPKKAEEFKKIHIQSTGEALSLSVNGSNVPVNAFVSKIVRNTMQGMLASLKGVTKPVKVNLEIDR